MSTCLKGRFDDVKKNHGDVILIKGMRIVNTNMWPRDRDSSQRCGHKTLHVDAERFRPVKRNEEWIVVASHMNEMYSSLSGETTVVTCPTMKFGNRSSTNAAINIRTSCTSSRYF